jgi:hypothetical protein
MFRINQLTGEKILVKEIREIEIHNKAWNAEIPPTQLQLFRMLVLTNLSQPQSDMMRQLQNMRSSFHTFEHIVSSSGGGSISVSAPNLDTNILSLVWEKFNFWGVLTRIVVVLVILNWAWKIYKISNMMWLQRSIRREVQRKLEKELDLGKLVEERIKNKSLHFHEKVQAVQASPGTDEERVSLGAVDPKFRNARRTLRRGRQL